MTTSFNKRKLETSIMIEESIRVRLEKFGKRGWTLKPYNMWGSDKPCPPRLVVNPYYKCAFRCEYCYIGSPARPQKGFREHLLSRIKDAKMLGLDKLVVMVSSSTDPFQPIERMYKESHFALEQLLLNGFPVLIMTRNPQMLLEEDYSEITNNPRLSVDVSIPSLKQNEQGSIYYSPVAAPLDETFDVMMELSNIGKYVRTKIEPVIPSINGALGQSREELYEIVRLSKEHGVKGVIAKTMRLNEDVRQGVRERLIDYYQGHGVNEGSTLALSLELKRLLIQPVLDACEKYGIPFCPCVDSDSIIGVSCRLGSFGSYQEG